MSYDLLPLKAPRSAGGLLRFLTRLAEGGATGGALAKKFLRDIGVEQMRAAVVTDPPSFLPPVAERAAGQNGDPIAAGFDVAPGPAEQNKAFPFETATDFATAYRDGRITPEEVAERVLTWTRESDALDPPLRAIIAQDAEDVRKQAKAASERIKAGKPLGPLDGVPVAIKDELDQRPYPTTVGTAFLGTSPSSADSTVVARMRAAGAVLIGKANMHELGMGVTGLNPHHGPARNPYDPARATGGSSSGPAAAVAAGLCPIAIGADGGGSVRIPAAFCGVVGLKPTFGRVSEHGAAPLCWSVAHIGPLAATARDTALAYGLIAGRDEHDVISQRQPAPTLAGVEQGDAKGLTLAVYPAWFDDAEPDVVKACRAVLDGLKAAGAKVVEVEIPELALARVAHLVTITSEMLAAHHELYRQHRSRYGLDIRLNLALVKHLKSSDYVHAQRLRTRLCRAFDRALDKADALVLPATTRTAPPLPADGLGTGESNLEVADQIMRNSPQANLTGLPAISFPAGYDAHGLPIGFQAIGRAWTEHVLLRLARVAEGFVVRQPSRVHRRLL